MAWSDWSWHQQWVQVMALVPAVGVSRVSVSSGCERGRCQRWVQEAAAGPNCPSGAGEGGEALRGDWGQQPPLAPSDSAERSGPAPGTKNWYKRQLWHQQQVPAAALAPAVGVIGGSSASSKCKC
uniref:Uncharacterized protein n=1 Tax=Myotis myotis TaxID=51298 RepID=A0A7J7YDX1_MYOMY|nr:hypothetical protein mMyoMyo1_011033 [Myotis myotis]